MNRKYKIRSEDKLSKGPTIAVGCLRDKSGKVVRYSLAELKPGMIIERGGKRYQVDKNGTQRRV